MKVFLKVCACIIALNLTTVSCYRHKFDIGNGGNTNQDAKYDEWESHWFFGIIGETEVNIAEVCPSGNATVQDRISFLNGLVTAILLGGLVWAPTTVRIYCEDGAGGEADEGRLEDTVEDIDDTLEEPGEAIDKEISLILTPTQIRDIALHPSTIQWIQRYMPERLDEYLAALQTYQYSRATASRIPGQF